VSLSSSLKRKSFLLKEERKLSWKQEIRTRQDLGVFSPLPREGKSSLAGGRGGGKGTACLQVGKERVLFGKERGHARLDLARVPSQRVHQEKQCRRCARDEEDKGVESANQQELGRYDFHPFIKIPAEGKKSPKSTETLVIRGKGTIHSAGEEGVRFSVRSRHRHVVEKSNT